MGRTKGVPNKRAYGRATEERLIDLVKALVAADAAGISSSMAYSLVDGQANLQAVAAYGRERGFPIVTERKGGDSRWYLAKYDTVLHEQWRERFLQDAYTFAVRAYAALALHNAVEAEVFLRAAIDLGGYLGKRTETVMRVAQPRDIGALKPALVQAGYLPADPEPTAESA